MNNPVLIPTILCGGSGSRLWPVSRELHPKPFIRLADGQSLLQKAFLRGAQLPNVEEILTITNRELFFKTEDEFREVNTTGLATSFVLEPFGRNTAAAIAAAALNVAKSHGEDALMLVLAATIPSFNIPVAGILLLMGIDHFLDMGRSAINVLGNGIATAMLAQDEGLLEEEPELVEREA